MKDSVKKYESSKESIIEQTEKISILEQAIGSETNYDTEGFWHTSSLRKRNNSYKREANNDSLKKNFKRFTSE